MEDKTKIIMTCVFIFIASVCEYIGKKTNGADEAFVGIHRMAKLFEFCVSPCIGVAAAGVYGEMKIKKSVMLLIVFYMFFQVAALFKGAVFSVDSGNIYHREKLYWIYVAVFLISLIYCFVCIVIGSQKYQVRFGAVNVTILTFLAFGISVQMFYNTITIDFMCVAIGNFFLYHYRGNVVNQIDAMTRLMNRRCFDRITENMKSSAYILFFDINKFKLINDTYGHMEGDRCLRLIGDAVYNVYGKYGLCFRVGGDELAAIVRCDAARLNLLNSLFEERVSGIRISGSKLYGVSLGYAYFDKSKHGVDDVIKEADMMMYKNKKILNTKSVQL